MKIIYRVYIAIIIVFIALGVVLQIGATASLGDNYGFLLGHLAKVVIGLVVLLSAAYFPYENYKKYSKLLLIIAIVFVLLTLLIGITKKGASRWIPLGFFSFQPSEVVKIFIVIHLAKLIEKKGELLKDFKRGFMPVMIWLGIAVFFIVLQPNLSAAILIFTVGFIMIFIANSSLKHIIITGLIGVMLTGGILMSFDHSRARILSKLGFNEKVEIDLQQYQSSVALGSGGLTGKGVGQSRQSDKFLPEAYGDFIYAILGEQLGFLGTVTVLLAYLALFGMGLIIAYMTKDIFGRFLAVGLSLVILLNALVNMAVVSGAMPVTGVTLPFISFGGTSMLVFSFAVGIILNIARKFIKNRDIEIVNEATA